MKPGWIALGGAGLLLLLLKKRGEAPPISAEPSPAFDPCSLPPPSRVSAPPGWKRLAKATPEEGAKAVAVLRANTTPGSFVVDGDRLYLVEWHCDETRGYHPGVSLFGRA